MWARILTAALGIWLMAAPAVLGYDRPASADDRIVGPLAAAFAIVAIWEVTRPLSWMNLLLGLWLIVAPWLLGYGLTATINSTVVGSGARSLDLCERQRQDPVRRRLVGAMAALQRHRPEKE